MKITLEMLTEDFVTVQVVRVFEDMMGVVEAPPHACAYQNSPTGRREIAEALADVPHYLNAVMAAWGDTPTVEDLDEDVDPLERGETV